MNKQRRGFLKQGLLASAAVLSSGGLLANSFQKSSSHLPNEVELTVFNAGVGGNNTVDLLSRIEKDCLALKPRLTILMAGTNDMNSVKHIPLKDYETNLDMLASLITRNGSKLLMMTILPAFEPDLLTRHPAAFYEPEGVAGRRKQINDIVKMVAKRHRAELLDLGLRFDAIGKIGAGKDSLIQNEANSNKRDGIHPTANGYRFIGLSVYDYIISNKLPQTGVVCFGDSITKGDGTIDRDSYPAYLKKLLSMSSI
jgi:lysophospholipase L1-like esterase